jgi:Flp pilus assembly protein TadG
VRYQHGLAIVELAVSAPLLLFLLYVIAELGNALYQYELLADAARNADRYLAANAVYNDTGVPDISGAVAATQHLVVYGNIGGAGSPAGSPMLPGLATGQVTVTAQTDAGGSTYVTVSVAYPYQSLLGGTIPNFVSVGSVNTAFTLNVFTSMYPLL